MVWMSISCRAVSAASLWAAEAACWRSWASSRAMASSRCRCLRKTETSTTAAMAASAATPAAMK